MGVPFIGLGFVATVVVVAGLGCDDAPDAAVAAVAIAADQTYSVRARIEVIRDDELVVAHEAIPSFVNAEGEAVGMAPMTMTFFRAPSLSMGAIGVGDPVEMTFEMRWHDDHAMTVTSVRALPPDTVLELAR